jgi:hypothetical protein
MASAKLTGHATPCASMRQQPQCSAHQLPNVLSQLDVDASIVKAQLQQLVSAALVAGMQRLLPCLAIVLRHCI